MPEFEIHFEWERAPRVRAPELSATWARLEIHAGGQSVTRVEAQRSAVRTGIYVPLFPIAEWMVSNWFFLWDEWRSDAQRDRHNLLAAREGFALPDLTFHPTESRMELSWRRAVAPYAGVEFLSEGVAAVPKGMVREEFVRLIEAVVDQLSSLPEDQIGSRLGSEWANLKEILANDEKLAFCERAARLGYDPFRMDDSAAEQIEHLGSVLPEPMIDDFCDAIPLGDVSSGAEAVRSFLRDAAASAPPAGRWAELSEKLGNPQAGRPWLDGYQQAAAFRRYLGLNGHLTGDPDEVLRERLGAFTTREFAAPPRIDAVSFQAEGSAPVFGVPAKLRDEQKRFVLARAVGDFLSFGESSLITRSQTEHQQHNRAFAAEFLAPADSIRAYVHGEMVDEEDVDELAAKFRVSPLVVRHQIENHRLAGFGG